MRLIDADKLLEVLNKKSVPFNANVNDAILTAPTVEERRKGKWITEVIGAKSTWYVCSECGRSVINDTGYDVVEAYPFCHCGADMRGEEE